MNNGKVNIFKCFIYSITSFDKYKVFLRQSTGKAVGYMILLSLLLSVVTFAPFFSVISVLTSELPTYLIDVIPDFSITDGNLEVYGEMPVVLDESDVAIVIDTSPNAESEILNQYDAVILITRDKMVLKNYVQRQDYRFSDYPGLNVDKSDLLEAMPMIKAYITLILLFIGLFAGIFFVIGKFLTVFIVSLIGLIANSSYKTNLSYKNIFKISLFSMTLPLIICTVLDVLPVRIPFVTLLFYVGTGVYIFGAINSIKKSVMAAGSGYGYYGSNSQNNYNSGSFTPPTYGSNNNMNDNWENKDPNSSSQADDHPQDNLYNSDNGFNTDNRLEDSFYNSNSNDGTNTDIDINSDGFEHKDNQDNQDNDGNGGN